MTMAHATAGVRAATLAFDRLAPDYDALAEGEIFRLLRRRTHAVFLRWLPSGCRVLEIGCGTGLDTSFLVAHGMRVVACDPSEAMVSRTLSRLATDGGLDRATVMPCGLQDLEPFLTALNEEEGFDGIVSNFGALNCVERLEPLGTLAARILRPGGALILGLMGRHCAVETMYFTLRKRRDLARRRRAPGAVVVSVAGIDVPTFYHRVNEVRTAMGPDFDLEATTGIGVAVPPPYLESRWQTLPAALRDTIAGLDRAIAAWPPFNRLGDHLLLQFTKRRSAHA